jgi:hypothetical protein
MGHVMDLVPNHMGIANSNPWWFDVLENGPSSRFAHFFDIEWHPVKDELAEKILIPILGDQYGAVLEAQELQLAYHDGAFCIAYHDRTLPIAPDTYAAVFEGTIDRWLDHHAGPDADELQSILTATRNLPERRNREPESIAVRAREKEIVKRRLATLTAASAEVAGLIDAGVRQLNGVAGQPRSFDPLDRLLNLQSYRLAHWRVASEEINYRRVFDVNELAALRMEDPGVFEAVHRFAFELVKKGAVTGLRIDHVDGAMRQATTCAACSSSARRTTRVRSTSWSRRFSAPASSSRRTGRCTARPATSSPRPSTTCSSTPATSARSTTSIGGSRANGGARSTTSRTRARSACCTKRCRGTSTRSGISSTGSRSAIATSATSRSTA